MQQVPFLFASVNQIIHQYAVVFEEEVIGFLALPFNLRLRLMILLPHSQCHIPFS